jgi:hypothetical protein
MAMDADGVHIESVFYVIVNPSGIPNLDTPTTVVFAVGLGNYMQLRLEHLFRRHCRHSRETRPPQLSSGQSSCLQTQRSRVRFPGLPDFRRSSGSGTGSTQPRLDK